MRHGVALRVLPALAAFAALGCQASSIGPKMLGLPGDGPGRPSFRGELEATLQLTTLVEHTALRRPSIDAMADAEVDAMVGYVRQHGRGELVLYPELQPRGTAGDAPRAPGSLRLLRAAAYLPSYLALESGPRELSRVAVAALGEALGDDAEVREFPASGEVSATDLVVEVREGIGFLGLRAIDDRMGDRIQALLDDWAHRSPPLRAVVLDLANCDRASPKPVAALVNAFAPGRAALELSFRDPDSGTLERRAWTGDARAATTLDAALPVFVVTSSRTGSLAEALASALRFHRTARILGSPTAGSGRLLEWYDLPWRASFGFTVADIVGADGEPLRGHPLIPDACVGGQGMAVVRERTLDGVRLACPDGEREISPALAIDYVRSLLASDAPPPEASPLQHGGEHG